MNAIAIFATLACYGALVFLVTGIARRFIGFDGKWASVVSVVVAVAISFLARFDLLEAAGGQGHDPITGYFLFFGAVWFLGHVVFRTDGFVKSLALTLKVPDGVAEELEKGADRLRDEVEGTP